MTALVILTLVYIYAHYGFASINAHITAMYLAFVSLALATGAPPCLRFSCSDMRRVWECP